MLKLKPTCPVDYRLCDQTVTVYHVEDGKYSRKVIRNAFLDERKTVTVEKTGSKEANSFLLLVPGDTQAVFPHDKVLRGEGPEIADRETWADFVPSGVPGLVVVDYVDCKYWNGRMLHTEAGG